MRCFIEKVVRVTRAATGRLTGPPALDLTAPEQATLVMWNHTIEQDHRAVKRRVNPGLGFGAFHSAQRTIQGYEASICCAKAKSRALRSGMSWPRTA
jgi:transposase-like protein